MSDTSHLDAIRSRLRRLRAALAAETRPSARIMRETLVRQAEREEAAEVAFLASRRDAVDEMSDDELLKELQA